MKDLSDNKFRRNKRLFHKTQILFESRGFEYVMYYYDSNKHDEEFNNEAKAPFENAVVNGLPYVNICYDPIADLPVEANLPSLQDLTIQTNLNMFDSENAGTNFPPTLNRLNRISAIIKQIAIVASILIVKR